jgi:hypothetical protein
MEREMSDNMPIRMLAVIGAAAVVPHMAEASMPVPYAKVGCIKDGRFQGERGVGPVLVDPAFKMLENKTIRVEGYLYPGDAFSARKVFVINNGCRQADYKSFFLCNPCQTTLDGPASKMLPNGSGREINVPEQALKELDLRQAIGL